MAFLWDDDPETAYRELCEQDETRRPPLWDTPLNIHPWGVFMLTDQNLVALTSWFDLMRSLGDDPASFGQGDRVLELLRTHAHATPGILRGCKLMKAWVLLELSDVGEASVFREVKRRHTPANPFVDFDWIDVSRQLARFERVSLNPAQWRRLEVALAQFPAYLNTTGFTRRLKILTS